MPPLAPAIIGGALPSLDLSETSVEEARSRLASERNQVMDLVDQYGGVLITTKALKSPTDFERCLSELVALSSEYPGGAPRKQVTSGGVFTSTEFASNLPIPGHTELGYMPHSKPELLAFFCEAAPVSGGMTPVIDMEEAFKRLPPSLVSRFGCGIFTSINMPRDEGRYISTLQGCFREYNKAWSSIHPNPMEVVGHIQQSTKEETHIEWQDEWLQPFQAMPAVERHRGKLVWTGFFPCFHPAGNTLQAAFDVVLHNRSLGQLKTLLSFVLHFALWSSAGVLRVVPGLGWLASKLGGPGELSCKLQDGKRIGVLDLCRILWVYNTLAVKWAWRPGQFVLLDNRRMGHMRTPYDPCRRCIFTAFGSRKGDKE